MTRPLFVLVALLGPAVAFGKFEPTKGPQSPDGTVAVTTDLPAELRKANISARGLGCCVFRSGEHAARLQGVEALYGWPEWMVEKGIAGGGWPEKVDKLLPQIAKDRGLPAPSYAQHTGGDATFLELALKTGRMVCVTYDGRDDFYRSSIGHMVNLVYLDGERGCILDNNRVGVYVWMTRAEFLSRWKGSGGGWAFVLLDAPPAPALAALPPPLRNANQ
jgi:hypothetical protein